MSTLPLLPPVAEPGPDDPLPGMLLAGIYQIERAVAGGGMGLVYLARHVTLGRKVAVKVLRQEYARDDEQAARFWKEAQAISAINHRGIIEVHHFDKLPDGRQYMVMEYLEGETLEQLIRRDAPLHPNRALPLMDEVLDALSAAHSVGVVHRDLKPSNVFLAMQSNGARYCKLLDFGLAQQKVLTGDEVQRFAKASLVAGTPEYISPEQARGHAATPRTDLYCFGVILFEMLTGRLPFIAPSLVELLRKHLHEKAPRVSAYAAVPDSLDALVASLLEKDGEQRPRSADVVRQSLARIRKELHEETTQQLLAPPPLKKSQASLKEPEQEITSPGEGPLTPKVDAQHHTLEGSRTSVVLVDGASRKTWGLALLGFAAVAGLLVFALWPGAPREVHVVAKPVPRVEPTPQLVADEPVEPASEAVAVEVNAPEAPPVAEPRPAPRPRPPAPTRKDKPAPRTPPAVHVTVREQCLAQTWRDDARRRREKIEQDKIRHLDQNAADPAQQVEAIKLRSQQLFNRIEKGGPDACGRVLDELDSWEREGR